MSFRESFLDAPEPGNVRPRISVARPEKMPEFHTVEIEKDDRSSAELEIDEKGREIAAEALRNDTRIWMRRSSGGYQQVYVIGVYESQVECCWVEPDGTAMRKSRSFSEVVEDQNNAKNEGRTEMSEDAEAHELLRGLVAVRRDRARTGRSPLKPLHAFDPETGTFFQISDSRIELHTSWSGNFQPRETEEGESPFESVNVRPSDFEDREGQSMSMTPAQLVRDQIAYFDIIESRGSHRQQEAIEEYIIKVRRRQAKNEDAQRQERWDFSDILRKEAGYSQREIIRGIYLSVAYIARERCYEMFLDYDKGSKGVRQPYRENIRINSDWNLSQKDAHAAFAFAKTQLDAGEDLDVTRGKVMEFVDNLQSKE